MTTPQDPYRGGYGQQPSYGQPPYGQQPQYGQPQPGPYPPPPGYGPPPKKKSSGGKIALIVIGSIVAVCLVLGVIGAVVTHKAVKTVTAKTHHTIVFKATAKTGALTLVNWTSLKDSAAVDNPPSPWTKTVSLVAGVGLAALEVTGSGTVTCELVVDGKVLSTAESPQTASCSHTIGV